MEDEQQLDSATKEYPVGNNKLYEGNIEQINRLVAIKVSKWKLKSIPSMDKDDVSQEIKTHILRKMHLYNPAKPIGNWLNVVINHAMINLMRNHYYKYAKPCLSCVAYEGNDCEGEGLCRIFSKCCSSCPIYAEWQQSKKANHDVSLPLPITNHENETHNTQADLFDLDAKLKELTFELKKKLSEGEFLVFESLYLECRTDTETAKFLGYRPDKFKGSGNRQIQNIKDKIIEKARDIIINGPRLD